MLKRLCTSAAMLLGITEAGITFDKSTVHSSDNGNDFSVLNRDKDSEKLTVHMVHHTHDDVGWLKTVDEYFTGRDDFIQDVQVHLILDSVVDALTADPRKRFSYVEMKFLSMWYYRASEEYQNKLKALIREGRFEIINAGWSMHDEACPHYEDLIHNMMMGHDFAMKEFGVKPRIGWSIDPFGHSNTNARFFAEMGFDAWFFARLDYRDKEKRLADQEMEFIWRSSYDELGNNSQIFTHALFQHYSSPEGFDFDILSTNDPFVGDESMTTFNAPKLSGDFHRQITHRISHYRSAKNLLVLMGDDFRFQNADYYFKSTDRLMEYYANSYGRDFNIELIYSTPSMYVDAVFAEGIEWPTKYDDMFPYADYDNAYWTGYFTSRPNDKAQGRSASHNLMASNRLYSMAAIDQTTTDEQMQRYLQAKDTMLDAVGVLQHHDGITGTGKKHVADNYAKLIYDSMQENNKVYTELLTQAAENSGISVNDWTWCLRTNSSYFDCPIAGYSNETEFVLAVHNPAMISQQEIKIPVAHGHYKVSVFNQNHRKFKEIDDAAVLCKQQRMELWPELLMNNCWLFAMDYVEANSISFYKFEYDASIDLTHAPQAAQEGQKISNFGMDLTFVGVDDDKGVEFQVTDGLFSQKNFYFDLKMWPGQQSTSSQPSGTYIFSVAYDVYEPIRYSKLQNVEVIESSVKSEFVLTYRKKHLIPTWQNQEDAIVYISVNHQLNIIEADVTFFSLPHKDDLSPEVTVNFEAKDFDNEDTFWTDSNGMAMQKRIKNFKETYEVNPVDNMNITANYYPIQTCISMRSTDGWQMNVMNTRSQGGSVLFPGRIELMQNRRDNTEDWRGMGEALNEYAWNGQGITVPARYYVQLFNTKKTQSLQRTVQQLQDSPMQYFYSFNPTVIEKTDFKTDMFGEKALNSHLSQDELKIEMVPLEKNKLRVRFENIADTYDQPKPKSIKIDLRAFADDLYQSVNEEKPAYVNIKEMSLSGNQLKAEMLSKKIQWKTVDDATVTPKFFNENELAGNLKSQGYQVTLQNQHIRVFEFEFLQ